MAAPGHEQMLVHNLRTPLTGIMASLEMLQDGDFGPLPEAQREVIQAMQAQGEELLVLIDELLEVASLGAPGPTVRLHAVDVAATVLELVAEWAPRFRGRLTSDVTVDRPAMADERLVRRVVGNLLMNASTHGGRDVSVSIRAEAAGSRVAIVVADDGPGIATAESERVFEPFVTLDAGAARGRRPGGLGLAYCRAAVAAMGGTIALVPSPRGAAFRIELPVAAPVPAEAPR